MSSDPIKYLSSVDAQLAGVIKAVGQYSIKVRNNAFQSLVESIIFKKYIDEKLPEEYEKCLVGLTANTKQAWNTSQQTEIRDDPGSN